MTPAGTVISSKAWRRAEELGLRSKVRLSVAKQISHCGPRMRAMPANGPAGSGETDRPGFCDWLASMKTASQTLIVLMRHTP